VTVTWAATNTTGVSYRIERSTDGGATWLVLVLGTFSGYYGLSYFDYPVASEQQVCYRVVATNAGGDAPPSNITCTTPPAGATLTATLVDPQTLELHWTDNSSVEDGYEVWLHVYRASYACCPASPQGSTCDSGIYEDYILFASLLPNATTYRTDAIPADTVCGPRTEYHYYVAVTKDGGTGSYSNVVSATTGAAVASLVTARWRSRGSTALANKLRRVDQKSRSRR